MKKIISLLLVAVMLVSTIPTVFAYEKGERCEDCGEYRCDACGKCWCDDVWDYDCDCTYYDKGTKVVYTAANKTAYTITVPATLAPGQSGTVTLSGTWSSQSTVKVTADPQVTLKNSISGADAKTLTVAFAGIEKAGNNSESKTYTETVSVANISNALFGTWSGKFNYNVEFVCPTGDINGDGVTDAVDLNLLNRHVGKISFITDEAQLARADMNGDGAVNSDDIVLLAELVNG